MAKKDLKYFMRNTEAEIVTAPGPDSFKDENGNVINFEIKVLSQAEINKINDAYRTRSMAVDKKGNPLVSSGEVVWKTSRDNAKASRHIIVEALQYPDLKDPDLMKYYNCVDVTEMPLLVFPKTDEYAHVTRIVMQALGLASTVSDEEELEAAKNS
uniref:Tail assembly protein n=1 Tax=Dulem virus 37 TaxID=3145755 RepID=A0AAU8AXJ6_9CAUD